MRSFQAVPESAVLWVGEPVGSVSLQRRELPDQRRQVTGYVSAYILGVLGEVRRITLPRTPVNRR